ncbi:MAG: EamA family transporter [Tessaracoccus sp.]
MGSVKRTSPTTLAVVMLLSSCVSLQLGAAVAVPVMGELGSWLTTAVRLLFAAAILTVLTRPAIRTWSGADWRRVVLYGVSLGGMNGTFYAAIARIPLGIGVTIEFLGPLVLAAVLSRRLRDIGWVLLAGGAVAVLGLSGHGQTGARLDPVGIGFALASAFFWAMYILAGKQVSAHVKGQGPLAVAMLVGGVLMLPFALPSAGLIVERPSFLLPLLVVALLSSVIPYSLELRALGSLNARTFGILLALEPVVAGIWGWLLLSQQLSPLQIAAMAAVLVASIATTVSERGPRPGGDVERAT